MSQPSERPSRRWPLAVAVVAAAAFVLKLAVALRSAGTIDVVFWQRFLAYSRTSGGLGLYRATDSWFFYFNHPPFMIHVLRVVGFLADVTPLPFRFWMRLPAILADLASLIVVARILRPRSPRAWLSLLLLAGAPASIMISGFHGNTDPVMIFFVLLSVLLVERRRSAWLAGLALGMGVNIKIWPLVLVPAILLYLPDYPKRFAYSAAAGATILVGSLPYLFQDPAAIAAHVLGYTSLYGGWGLSRLLSALAQLTPAFGPMNSALSRWGRFALLGVIVAVSWWMNRSSRKPPLFLQCTMITSLFLVLTPGFGVQYLAWLIPWVAGLGLWATLLYYSSSGIFLCFIYNFHALAARLTNFLHAGDWRGYTDYFRWICWACVLAILFCSLQAIRQSRQETPAPAALN